LGLLPSEHTPSPSKPPHPDIINNAKTPCFPRLADFIPSNPSNLPPFRPPPPKENFSADSRSSSSQ